MRLRTAHNALRLQPRTAHPTTPLTFCISCRTPAGYRKRTSGTKTPCHSAIPPRAPSALTRKAGRALPPGNPHGGCERGYERVTLEVPALALGGEGLGCANTFYGQLNEQLSETASARGEATRTTALKSLVGQGGAGTLLAQPHQGGYWVTQCCKAIPVPAPGACRLALIIAQTDSQTSFASLASKIRLVP